MNTKCVAPEMSSFLSDKIVAMNTMVAAVSCVIGEVCPWVTQVNTLCNGELSNRTIT
jgi:hypothetical protein